MSAEETVIIKTIVHSLHVKTRVEVLMRLSMGQNGSVPPKLLAVFLFENPGARRIWLLASEEEQQRFSLISARTDFMSNFRADVLSALERLDNSTN